MEFHGYTGSAGGLKSDPNKRKALWELKESTNRTKVRSFLGTVNQLGELCRRGQTIKRPPVQKQPGAIDITYSLAL